MTKFAQDTEVSPEKSRMEIERVLVKYGATGFAYGWEGNNAAVMFIVEGRHIRFMLPMPDKESREIKFKAKNSWCEMSASDQQKRYDKLVRQRWRAMALVIKAKLECVESGITTVEKEFLAHIVLPNGMTVEQAILPKIAEAYQTGKMPLLLGSAMQ